MSNFLILGLPRSRTAWLANFMTYDGEFCYHEGINGCSSMDEYKEKVKGKGDSNTALALFDFEPHFPNVKIVIIDNDIDKAVEFGLRQGCDVTEAMMIERRRLDALEGLHVHVDEIDDSLADIWCHLSDKPFDAQRAEMLINLDIQIRDVGLIDRHAMSKFIETTNGYLPLQA